MKLVEHSVFIPTNIPLIDKALSQVVGPIHQRLYNFQSTLHDKRHINKAQQPNNKASSRHRGVAFRLASPLRGIPPMEQIEIGQRSVGEPCDERERHLSKREETGHAHLTTTGFW